MRGRRRGVCRVIALFAAGAMTACAGAPSGPAAGGSGPVTFEITDITEALTADDRVIRWDYVVVLRETRGVGIQFERYESVLLGPTVDSAPVSTEYRQRLAPNSTLRLTLSNTIHLYQRAQTQFGYTPGGRAVTAMRRLYGKDDAGKPVTVDVRAHLGPGAGKRLARPAVAPGPQASPRIPVSSLSALAGEWQGHFRNVDGLDLPLALVIKGDGSFEVAEGEPVRNRFRGTLAVRDGQIAWTQRTSTGMLSLHEDGGKRIIAGRVLIPRPARPDSPATYDIRVEALDAATRQPPAVANTARPSPPPAPAPPAPGPGPLARAPAGPAPTVVFRFPPDQARLPDTFTVVVADVTPGQGSTVAVVTVNGTRVHEQSEQSGRSLALNVPVILREGTNVIVVSATDAQGGVRQEVRSVVHESAAGIRVSYRVRGNATWVNLLYRAPDGRTEQKRVLLPVDSAWELLFNARQGDSLEVTAQSVGDPGSVTCEIVVDGHPIAQNAGEVQNAHVSCRGVVTAP